MTKQELLKDISERIDEVAQLKTKYIKQFGSVKNGDYQVKACYIVEAVRDEIENILYDFMYNYDGEK